MSWVPFEPGHLVIQLNTAFTLSKQENDAGILCLFVLFFPWLRMKTHWKVNSTFNAVIIHASLYGPRLISQCVELKMVLSLGYEWLFFPYSIFFFFFVLSHHLSNLKGKKKKNKFKHTLANQNLSRRWICSKGAISQLVLISFHSSIPKGGCSSLPGYRIE